jgi:hypothetical protein
LNFIKFDGKQFVFHISARDKSWLMDLLRLYPLIPATHARLHVSRDKPDAEKQQLLEQALAEQRTKHREQTLAMLNEPNRFQKITAGFRFNLTPEQLDWLLQVLNDIRVGSWIMIGEPDEQQEIEIEVTEKNAPYLWTMQLAALFQSVLLKAANLP